MNTNQYGFTSRRSTIDAAMGVKDFVESLVVGELIVLVSIDVKGALKLLGGLES